MPDNFSFALEPGDGGPVYRETNLGRWIAEPWNAGSALAFFALAVFWGVRLRGKYARHPFLAACLPLLAVGGVGGTLYHAFRASYAFFLLDVVPITILALATSLYLWARLLPRRWFLLVMLPPAVLAAALPRAEPNHRVINLTYAALAGVILAPALLMLLKTRGVGSTWFLLSLSCFAVALCFRYTDAAWHFPGLPMGTHWLWHLFGAGSTGALAEYLYCLGEAPEKSLSPSVVGPGDSSTLRLRD
jgi:hemolysin III